MISFLHSLIALFSQAMKILENFQSNKQRQLKNNLRNKADAYDKLQKAIGARNIARKSNTADHLMSDDGYQRK